MKKNRRALKMRRRKRYIIEMLKPLEIGVIDTVELVLVCVIIAVFRFIITGKNIFIKGYTIQAMFIIFALISLLIAEMNIVKKETTFDIIFIIFSKVLKAFLSLISIIIVCIM